MEQDVVCGMQVDPAKAAAKSEYNGKTYYFCSASCKSKFDANPLSTPAENLTDPPGENRTDRRGDEPQGVAPS
jgi:YHS domain-containing protein